MYKFVKVKSIGEDGLTYKEWFFYCTTIQQLEDFQKIIHSGNQVEALKNYFTTKTLNGHLTNFLAIAYNNYANLNEESTIEAISKLDRTAYLAKLEHIQNETPVLIRENGSFMSFKPDILEIVETVEKERLVFPNDYEITIPHYPGGKHYYAKVGKIDVTDTFGNQKWNTVKSAEAAAEAFLKTLK